MQTIAPVAHDAARCFICAQYRVYFDKFCQINDIACVFADYPFPTAKVIDCHGRIVLMINDRLDLTEWLPRAYELVGLPCFNFDLSDGTAHLGQFLSLN